MFHLPIEIEEQEQVCDLCLTWPENDSSRFASNVTVALLNIFGSFPEIFLYYQILIRMIRRNFWQSFKKIYTWGSDSP